MRRNHLLGDRRRRRREEVGLPDGAEAHPPAYQYPHPLTNPYGDGRRRSAPPSGPSRPSQQLQYLPHHLGFRPRIHWQSEARGPAQTTPGPNPRPQTPRATSWRRRLRLGSTAEYGWALQNMQSNETHGVFLQNHPDPNKIKPPQLQPPPLTPLKQARFGLS